MSWCSSGSLNFRGSRKSTPFAAQSAAETAAKVAIELAEMKARVDAAKYLVYKAGLKKQQAMNGAKVRYSVEAAEAKLIAARTAGMESTPI